MSNPNPRVAILTPEFPLGKTSQGGVGNCFYRMAHALHTHGCGVEVFVLDKTRVEKRGALPGGVGVTLCPVVINEEVRRVARGLEQKIKLPAPSGTLNKAVSYSYSLCGPFLRAEKKQPFDLLVSVDYHCTTLLLPPGPRKHLAYCCEAHELCSRADGVWQNHEVRIESLLRRQTIRRAGVPYVSSRFVRDHVKTWLGREVQIIPNIAWLETDSAPQLPDGLPPRYLLHFGRVSPTKGSHLFASALLKAWEREPGLRAVIAGTDFFRMVPCFNEKWGQNAKNVTYLGPVEKPVMYALLNGAEAAVLPSVSDNTPNTVVEALLLGVPVVGMASASINEIVTENVTGHLAPVGDVDRLADAMVRVWRGESPVKKGFSWDDEVRRTMEPAAVAQKILQVAGLG